MWASSAGGIFTATSRTSEVFWGTLLPPPMADLRGQEGLHPSLTLGGWEVFIRIGFLHCQYNSFRRENKPGSSPVLQHNAALQHSADCWWWVLPGLGAGLEGCGGLGKGTPVGLGESWSNDFRADLETPSGDGGWGRDKCWPTDWYPCVVEWQQHGPGHPTP